MLRMKESYGYGYRLFNPHTGKYVEDNAKNRVRALFGELVSFEAKKEHPTYPVKRIFNIFIDALKTPDYTKPITNSEVFDFTFILRIKLELGDFSCDKNFRDLSSRVLHDQQDRASRTIYDFDLQDKIVEECNFMNKHILDKQENQENNNQEDCASYTCTCPDPTFVF